MLLTQNLDLLIRAKTGSLISFVYFYLGYWRQACRAVAVFNPNICISGPDIWIKAALRLTLGRLGPFLRFRSENRLCCWSSATQPAVVIRAICSLWAKARAALDTAPAVRAVSAAAGPPGPHRRFTKALSLFSLGSLLMEENVGHNTAAFSLFLPGAFHCPTRKPRTGAPGPLRPFDGDWN